MKRRHLLALVILALVVATVMAMGPVRVWDAMTLRTVEEYWPSGGLQRRYRVRLWQGRAHMQDHCDTWYENGQKRREIRQWPVYRMRGWSDTGQLRTYVVAGTGIHSTPAGRRVLEQVRMKNDVVVETRRSRPWFTEEEILRSVEGIDQ